MSAFEKFFNNNKGFLEEVKHFQSKWKLNVISHMEKQAEDELLSSVSEMRFGLFFDCLGEHFSYEAAIGKSVQTPDWQFYMNSQHIICEVLRLNPAKEEKTKLDFTDSALETLSSIRKPYVLHIDWIDYDMALINSDLEDFHDQVEKWLKSNPSVGKSLLYNNSIRVEVDHISNTLEHVVANGGGGSVEYKPWRLLGEKSTFFKKISKYKDIVKIQNRPFIICIYLDFHSWLDEEELFNGLYGYPTEHADTGYYSHDLSSGLYYLNNHNILPPYCEAVSGVLARRGETYTYYHNFTVSNKLSKENSKILLHWQYKYPE